MIYEMILGYCLQSFWTGYLIAISYRLLGNVLIHLLSKAFLYHRIESYFQDSKYFHALLYLARKRPYQTLFIVRFSHLPEIILDYGTPILGYNMAENVGVAFAVSLFLCMVYVLFGVSARSIEEIEAMKPTGGPSWIQYAPLAGALVGVSIIIYLFFSSKAKIQNIVKKYELDDLKERLARKSYGSLDFY